MAHCKTLLLLETDVKYSFTVFTPLCLKHDLLHTYYTDGLTPASWRSHSSPLHVSIVTRADKEWSVKRKSGSVGVGINRILNTAVQVFSFRHCVLYESC